LTFPDDRAPHTEYEALDCEDEDEEEVNFAQDAYNLLSSRGHSPATGTNEVNVGLYWDLYTMA